MRADKVKQSIDHLLQRSRNLVMATIDSKGEPLCSQSPFVLDEQGNFYVLVSALAEHGKSLALAKTINLLVMEIESGLTNPYARERLNFTCTVEAVEKGNDIFSRAEVLLKVRFGNFVDTLLQLADFKLYRLTPVQGRYVAGFGSAYLIQDGEITAITSAVLARTR